VTPVPRWGLFALLACVAGSAQAARVPAPDPAQGDGRVSGFYTWTEEIPAQPGRMLRTEPLDPLLGLPDAGRQLRILYTSTDGVDGKAPVVVSGALFLPQGTPPAGGWPLIAWAHGTTGIADVCAPSWLARSLRDQTYLSAWLAQGYAVVATDYQGLGTPGPHPYLRLRPEVYSVLDSVRAVLHGDYGLANPVVIVGQSQGGGAAFATAGMAPDYAPEIDIRGTVATGVPYMTPALLRPPPSEITQKPDHTFAYTLYLALMLSQGAGASRAEDLVTTHALPSLELARSVCVGDMFNNVLGAELNRSIGLTSHFADAFRAVLPALEYTTLKLKQPVFIGTGAEDRDVRPTSQMQLAKDACAAGTTVEAHLYTGLSHSGTVNASLKDSLPFVRKVLAGEPITPACEPMAQ